METLNMTERWIVKKYMWWDIRDWHDGSENDFNIALSVEQNNVSDYFSKPHTGPLFSPQECQPVDCMFATAVLNSSAFKAMNSAQWNPLRYSQLIYPSEKWQVRPVPKSMLNIPRQCPPAPQMECKFTCLFVNYQPHAHSPLKPVAMRTVFSGSLLLMNAISLCILFCDSLLAVLVSMPPSIVHTEPTFGAWSYFCPTDVWR